jgi:DnaA family protein
MRQLPLNVRLAERARFSGYFAGPNAAALARLEALARHPQAGLLWLHGPAGTGKSHLLQALCAAHGGDALYLPLDGILSMGAAALAGWQGAALLCIDALAAVTGQQDWEHGLFNLYRDCEERAVPILMAARETPRQLPFALPDLASRCAAGELLGILPLDEAQQRAALVASAAARGLELPEDAVRFLQRHLARDTASLFAALERLDAAALAAQRRLTLPFVRETLRD